MALAGELAKYIGGELVKNTGKELATNAATSALSNLAPKIATKAVADMANKSVLNSLVPTATRKLASGIELGTDMIPMFRGQTNTLDKLDYNKGLSPNSNGFFMTPNKSATDSWAGKGVVSVDADPNDIMTLDELRSLKKSAEKYFRDPKYQMELYNTNPTQAEIYDALEAGDNYQELSRLTKKPFIERDGGQGTELGEVVFFPDTNPELTSRYNADLASGKNQWLAPTEDAVASETAVPAGTKIKFDKDLNIKDIEKPSRGRGWYADNETNPHISQVVKQNGLDKYLGEPKINYSLAEEPDMVTIYHNTKAENIPSILEQGLIPGKRPGGYLVSPEEAGIWTDDRGLKSGSYGGTTVKIRVPKKEFDATRVNDTQNLLNRAIKPSEIEGVDYMLYDTPLIKNSNLQEYIDKYGEDKVRELIEKKGLVSPEVIDKSFSDLKSGRSLTKPNIQQSKVELSPQQQEFFKDSVIRDNSGMLKKMYHGSPNGEIKEFNPGSYFTENKEYADGYQNPEASSLMPGARKIKNTPKTYEVYLNIKKPFTLSDARAKDIYLNEYIKGGNSAYYDPYGTTRKMIDDLDEVDWTEGTNLMEWLQENHPEYDGMYLDEGGTGGYSPDNEYVDRGKSLVNFRSDQVKILN